MRNIRIPQVFTLTHYYVDPFTLIQYQQITKKIKQKRQAIFTACRLMSEALTNYRTNL